MKYDDIKPGQCFRFKGQKSVWVLARDYSFIQIIGKEKGKIRDFWNVGVIRKVEIVEIQEAKK